MFLIFQPKKPWSALKGLPASRLSKGSKATIIYDKLKINIYKLSLKQIIKPIKIQKGQIQGFIFAYTTPLNHKSQMIEPDPTDVFHLGLKHFDRYKIPGKISIK